MAQANHQIDKSKEIDMCGRFTLATSVEDIAAQFGVSDISVEHDARYNVAPTQEVLVLVKNGERRLDKFRWGLVPHWSKGPNTRYSMINARAETVAEKPSYRGPFAKRRCLVLADGFSCRTQGEHACQSSRWLASPLQCLHRAGLSGSKNHACVYAQ